MLDRKEFELQLERKTLSWPGEISKERSGLQVSDGFIAPPSGCGEERAVRFRIQLICVQPRARFRSGTVTGFLSMTYPDICTNTN